MITCIKCRQKYSEQDHRCLEVMSLAELMSGMLERYIFLPPPPLDPDEDPTGCGVDLFEVD